MLKNPKKILIALSALAILAVGGYYAWAASVSDSYDNLTKIAGVWNVSTSTAGELKLAPKTCDIFTWYCSASTTCANTAGDGRYIIVAQADASSSKQWKTTNTACDKPQCNANGGQDGDKLKSNNLINFTNYPARDYCKSIGARLPTKEELNCMYTNRATFGNNFGSGSYWSSTEDSDSFAWYQAFPSGTQNSFNKTNSNYVRCVRGW